jgi:hypothetical protein
VYTALVEFVSDFVSNVSYSSFAAGAGPPFLREWLSDTLYVPWLFVAAAPIALVAFVLHHRGLRLRDLGLDRPADWQREVILTLLALGTLAALQGFGPLERLLSLPHASLGDDATSPFGTHRISETVLSAAEAVRHASVTAVVIVGYLLLTLRELGVRQRWAVLACALLQAAIVLQYRYGAIPQFAAGLLLAAMWWRTGRLWPIIAATTITLTFTMLNAIWDWYPSLAT